MGNVTATRLVWRLLPPLVALVAFLPSLDNGFSLDDYNWLERAQFAPTFADFVLRREPGQTFSPIANSFYFALHSLFGEVPTGYRITILILHAANASLLYGIGLKLTSRASLSSLGACLFAAQSAGNEAIFWIAAFAHVLATFFTLSCLLFTLRFHDGSAPRDLVVSLLCFTAATLTKAAGLVALPVVALVIFLVPAAQRNRFAILPFVLIAVLVVGYNVSGFDEPSYLIERGYYAAGWHVLSNLFDYAGALSLPFPSLAARVGMGPELELGRSVLASAALLFLSVCLLAGTVILRLASCMILLALLPFLPFVFAPTSRYLYLSSAGCMLLFTGFVAKHVGRGVSVSAALVTLSLVGMYAAENIVIDNHYEFRERQMRILVGDVRREVAELNSAQSITIYEFPTFAIDRGIHFAAALRLAYDAPDLRLEVPRELGHVPPPGALHYSDGRIHRLAGDTSKSAAPMPDSDY